MYTHPKQQIRIQVATGYSLQLSFFPFLLSFLSKFLSIISTRIGEMLIYTHTQDANDYTTGSIERKKKGPKAGLEKNKPRIISKDKP